LEIFLVKKKEAKQTKSETTTVPFSPPLFKKQTKSHFVTAFVC
jgi:hypothetical protein